MVENFLGSHVINHAVFQGPCLEGGLFAWDLGPTSGTRSASRRPQRTSMRARSLKVCMFMNPEKDKMITQGWSQPQSGEKNFRSVFWSPKDVVFVVVRLYRPPSTQSHFDPLLTTLFIEPPF